MRLVSLEFFSRGARRFEADLSQIGNISAGAKPWA